MVKMFSDELALSSKNDQWETPQALFEQLNNEFHFNLDPCADEHNHKCDKFYTIQDNGLEKNWEGYNVFCNPPYSRRLGEWVRKAYEESLKPNTTVVMLIPSRTETKYFHEYIYGKAEIRFIRGRLKFGTAKYNAPFGSMIVVYKGGKQ